MYDQVLLTTDGSEAAESATPHALAIASRFGAILHIVSVIDADAFGRSFESDQIDFHASGAFDTDEVDQFHDTITASLEQMAAQAQQEGLDVVPAITKGLPHQAISDYAEENDIDLIVMGSRGHDGVRRIMLGSVTERVARTASMPVLITDRESVGEETTDEHSASDPTSAPSDADSSVDDM